MMIMPREFVKADLDQQIKLINLSFLNILQKKIRRLFYSTNLLSCSNNTKYKEEASTECPKMNKN